MTIKCLGIESTAHTFGAGIVSYDKENFKIHSDQKSCFFPEKGITPYLAATHHAEEALKIIKTALLKAGTEMKDIDIISYSIGPGLAPCLNIGSTAAKILALKYKKPLIGVNHCVAHIEIAKELTKCPDDFVAVFVSGGNSQILSKVNGKYRIFGETQDIAVGNAIDKFARNAGLGFPGGPLIENLAKGGKYLPLPYSVKGCDFSFAGLITKTQRMLEKNTIQDICFSLQEVMFCGICESAERVLGHLKLNNLILTGGVARNKILQSKLKTMTSERGAKLFCVPDEFAGDNGTMIAVAGIKNYMNKINCFGEKDIPSICILPKLRIDE
ncbi:MAG: tRNA (adenosine(37)-N6)-threonylcarbamoyltransferase complex transferase subunit TsaD [Candidatus Aenigmarchaeota archaeon]|nr:tRNA (adenosine(37)-N6)-threonylcarbamoyltransferase complex transferase subunit TsaD [Candidatus Aenigmarchaeota archaeon]